MKTGLLTTLAMLAFAANSLLCRWALGNQLIDPASFANLRVVSGAVLLAFLLSRRTRDHRVAAVNSRDWTAALALAVYLLFFSFAYVSLQAGSGALILFGAVQLTMFAAALYQGERFSVMSWVGFFLAISGLIYLLLPGLSAPPIAGAMLMTLAGIGWGIYSLRGRGAVDSLRSTGQNFTLAVPLVMAVNLMFAGNALLTPAGVVLAICSGMFASALGYVVWYAALTQLRAMSAATVQLSVPVITALGGVLLLSEDLTLRLTASSVAILGGIAVVVMQRSNQLKDS